MSWLDIIINIAQILTGLATIVLLFSLISTNKREYRTAYSEQINRTFFYIEKITLFKLHFDNFYRYLQYKRTSEPLKIFTIAPNGIEIPLAEGAAEYQLNRNLTEFYVYIKEINSLLSNNKHKLIDQKLLRDAFESYKLNLNNFFMTAFEIVASREIKFGNIHGLYGDFTREDLVNLNESLKRYFDFID